MEKREQDIPKLAPNVYIAPGAVVKGDVTIGAGSSVWYQTTIRTEHNAIVIGENTNIQDNCVLHVNKGEPMEIGNGVTVGHGAIVHGKKVGDNTLIGMGAILLNGSVIGANCIIGAGTLVTQNTVIPDNSLVIGQPGRVKREVSPEEIEANRINALHYVEDGRRAIDEYRKGTD